uniref:CSON014534 protein n=1 Tax=Culicoides sonorensis TaxID=179676 RepID=A0A336MDL6_CULSO
MVSLQSIAIASIVFLIVLVQQASAAQLSCYICTSYNETRCKDDVLPDEFKKNCGTFKHPDGQYREYSICRKIVQTIEFAVNGLEPETRVIRSCGWDNSTYQGRCYQRAGFGGRQEVCGCFDNYCNGANSHSLVFGVTILSVVLAYFAQFKKNCGTFKHPDGQYREYSICRKIVQTIEFAVNGRHAIRCYECNSHNDSRCAEAIPPEALSIDCDSRVIRGCGYDDSSYKNRCYQRSGFGGRQEVCACDTDNCNSATSMSLGFGLIIASVAI